MNPPASSNRLPPYLESAIQRVRMAARSAAERTVDSLGLAALSSNNVYQRDAFLGAQFELNRKLAIFALTFNEKLDKGIARDVAPLLGNAAPPATDWDALSLVDDQEVENQVSADRFALEIQHECEWELRELDAFMGSVLRMGSADSTRNPLRPELIGMAMMRAVDAVATDRPESRKVLATELGRQLAAALKQTYIDVAQDLRASGVKPVGLSVRQMGGPGFATGRYQSGYDTLDGAPSSRSGLASTGAGHLGGYGGPGGQGAPAGYGGPGGVGGAQMGSGRGAGAGAARGMMPGTPIGQVDPRLMSLMRRLSVTAGPETSPGALGAATGPGGMPGSGFGMEMAPAPNVILAHRDELRRLATGSLDHMVIDVVGSLFDQILSDPKVPPQMARQIARLQLPVLRAALGDNSFFSSRRHPVRRFVNRIASLAVAYDDYEQADARAFLLLVKDLVQQVVEGDFDHIQVYEAKLAELEQFITDQARREVHEQGHADELLARKETELRLQQQYALHLQAALQPVPVEEFLRDFIANTWSAVVTRAASGPDGAQQAERFRAAGRELVMSVQPKGLPAQRKAFLLALPQLMKDLNAGMDLVQMSEAARKAFFGQLLPAHAQALKGQALSTLDHNMLVKQVEQILSAPLPKAADLPQLHAGERVALPEAGAAPSFSEEEAQAIGLIDEASVDWNGQVDIDLGAEPEVTEVDINIDGLPPPEPVEPASGKSLADHVQIGFAYQMHLEGDWHKVRLAHMSQGRTFFVFTRGSKHKRTISMTYRMLARMCETGRMRAFESGYLIERATARARRQLAKLGVQPTKP